MTSNSLKIQPSSMPCRKTSWYVRVSMLAALVSLVLMGCGESQQGANAFYQIKDSGYHTLYDRPYWIDDRRVIFYGHGKRPIRSMEEKKEGLYIWNTSSGEVEFYDHATTSGCYFDGYLTYGRRYRNSDGEIVSVNKRGAIGEEVTSVYNTTTGIRLRGGEVYEQPEHFVGSPVSCKPVEHPPHMIGRYFVPLRPEDGYLDFGDLPVRIDEMPKATYHRQGEAEQAEQAEQAEEAISLPFSLDDIYTGIRWYAHEKRYFFRYAPKSVGVKMSWRNTDCLPSWWMSPDGKTDKVCIPAYWYDYEVADIYPTKLGYVLSVWDDKRAGLYLAGDHFDGQERIVEGKVYGVDVSEDGCRLAYGTNPDPKNPDGWNVRLQMVDICTDTAKPETD